MKCPACAQHDLDGASWCLECVAKLQRELGDLKITVPMWQKEEAEWKEENDTLHARIEELEAAFATVKKSWAKSLEPVQETAVPREPRWVRLRVLCYDLNEQEELVPAGFIPVVVDAAPTLEELQAEVNRLKAQAGVCPHGGTMHFALRRTSDPYISHPEGVEIGSLEELIALAAKEGSLIITDDPPAIEIYDDYRE